EASRRGPGRVFLVFTWSCGQISTLSSKQISHRGHSRIAAKNLNRNSHAKTQRYKPSLLCIFAPLRETNLMQWREDLHNTPNNVTLPAELRSNSAGNP